MRAPKKMRNIAIFVRVRTQSYPSYSEYQIFEYRILGVLQSKKAHRLGRVYCRTLDGVWLLLLPVSGTYTKTFRVFSIKTYYGIQDNE